MQTQRDESSVTRKTRELCQTILDEPGFQQRRRQIDAFLADEAAKAQYQLVVEKGENLHHKQQNGHALTDEEVQDFEKERELLLDNPVARAFLDAQQEMQRVQDSVRRYVARTIELGRVPSEEDFQSGSCGSGCGCHH